MSDDEQEQLDFLRQVLPVEGPYWGGSGYWCCPRCWQTQQRKWHILISLTFGPESDYRIGRCRECGYWARFEHAFGGSRHMRNKGKVVAFGVDPEQAAVR